MTLFYRKTIYTRPTNSKAATHGSRFLLHTVMAVLEPLFVILLIDVVEFRLTFCEINDALN